MQSRPPAIVVPAIMFFLFEAFAVFGVLSNFVTMSLIKPGNSALANPMLTAMNASPEFALYTRIMSPISLLLAVFGIVTALGLLRGREGARKAGIVLASIKVLIAIVGGWMTMNYMGVMMEKAMVAVGGPKVSGDAEVVVQSTMKLAMTASAVGGAVFGVGIAVVMIVLLTRSSARAYCSGQFIEAMPPPLP